MIQNSFKQNLKLKNDTNLCFRGLSKLIKNFEQNLPPYPPRDLRGHKLPVTNKVEAQRWGENIID